MKVAHPSNALPNPTFNQFDQAPFNQTESLAQHFPTQDSGYITQQPYQGYYQTQQPQQGYQYPQAQFGYPQPSMMGYGYGQPPHANYGYGQLPPQASYGNYPQYPQYAYPQPQPVAMPASESTPSIVNNFNIVTTESEQKEITASEELVKFWNDNPDSVKAAEDGIKSLWKMKYLAGLETDPEGKIQQDRYIAMIGLTNLAGVENDKFKLEVFQTLNALFEEIASDLDSSLGHAGKIRDVGARLIKHTNKNTIQNEVNSTQAEQKKAFLHLGYLGFVFQGMKDQNGDDLLSLMTEELKKEMQNVIDGILGLIKTKGFFAGMHPAKEAVFAQIIKDLWKLQESDIDKFRIFAEKLAAVVGAAASVYNKDFEGLKSNFLNFIDGLGKDWVTNKWMAEVLILQGRADKVFSQQPGDCSAQNQTINLVRDIEIYKYAAGWQYNAYAVNTLGNLALRASKAASKEIATQKNQPAYSPMLQASEEAFKELLNFSKTSHLIGGKVWFVQTQPETNSLIKKMTLQQLFLIGEKSPIQELRVKAKQAILEIERSSASDPWFKDVWKARMSRIPQVEHQSWANEKGNYIDSFKVDEPPKNRAESSSSKTVVKMKTITPSVHQQPTLQASQGFYAQHQMPYAYPVPVCASPAIEQVTETKVTIEKKEIKKVDPNPLSKALGCDAKWLQKALKKDFAAVVDLIVKKNPKEIDFSSCKDFTLTEEHAKALVPAYAKNNELDATFATQTEYNTLGLALRESKNTDLLWPSIRTLHKGIKLKETSTLAGEMYYNCGRSYLLMGKDWWENASLEFRKGITINSDNDAYYRPLVNCFMHMGNYYNALDTAKKAYALNKIDSNSYYLATATHYKYITCSEKLYQYECQLSEVKDALIAADEYLNNNPTHEDMLRMKSNLLSMLDHLKSIGSK